MNIIAVYDKYKGDKMFMIRLVFIIIECCKAAILIVPCCFTKTGDWVSAILSVPLGLCVGWGYIKQLDQHYSASRYFVYRRLQIFVVTCCMTFTVVMLSFSWFMYNNEMMYQTLKIRYACESIM